MSRTVALSGWAVIAAAVAVVETVGRLRPTAISPLSGLLAALRGSRGGRTVLLLGWIWVGWHLFVR